MTKRRAPTTRSYTDMEVNLILLGVLPAVGFAVAALLLARRHALLVGLSFAVLELAYTLWAFGGPDALSVLSLLLTVALAVFALLRDEERWFRLYPLGQDLLFAGSFLFFYYWRGQPLLVFAFEKYLAHNMDSLKLLAGGDFMPRYLQLLSRDLGWWFVGHALLAGWAAWQPRRSVWLVAAVFGQLLMLVVAVAVAAAVAL